MKTYQKMLTGLYAALLAGCASVKTPEQEQNELEKILLEGNRERTGYAVGPQYKGSTAADTVEFYVSGISIIFDAAGVIIGVSHKGGSSGGGSSPANKPAAQGGSDVGDHTGPGGN